MTEMNLYVWSGVLCDYTPGMMLAFAPSIERAREMLRAALPEYDKNNRDLNKEPERYEVTEEFCTYVYGGG